MRQAIDRAKAEEEELNREINIQCGDDTLCAYKLREAHKRAQWKKINKGEPFTVNGKTINDPLVREQIRQAIRDSERKRQDEMMAAIGANEYSLGWFDSLWELLTRDKRFHQLQVENLELERKLNEEKRQHAAAQSQIEMLKNNVREQDRKIQRYEDRYGPLQPE